MTQRCAGLRVPANQPNQLSKSSVHPSSLVTAKDEARRIAANIAKLLELLRR
jgi:hypothetical protein